MKIAFIMPNTLPMPSVRGGAVESIIQNYIDMNEKTGKFEIIVFSKYDEQAYLKSLEYKKTIFEYINDKFFINFALKRVLGVLNIMCGYRIGNVYIRKVINKLKSVELDCVIIENAPYYLPVIKKRTKCPVGIHIHNDYPFNMKKLVKQYCDKAYCVSNFIMNEYKDHDNGNKFAVLYNCVDISRFRYDSINREIIRSKLKIEKDDKVFIFSGRLIEEKGVLELVKSFVKICCENKKLKLIVVGGKTFSDNNSSKYIRKCFKVASHAGKSIVFTGYVQYHQLHKYYSAADVGIIPSLCNEAAPLSIIEMFASGLEVIVNDIAGLSEMAKYGDSYYINQECDIEAQLSLKIQELANKDNERKKYDLNVFSIDNFVKCFEHIVEETCIE